MAAYGIRRLGRTASQKKGSTCNRSYGRDAYGNDDEDLFLHTILLLCRIKYTAITAKISEVITGLGIIRPYFREKFPHGGIRIAMP
jgi:hypothetical protein